MKKTEMRVLDKEERIKNFDEVALGYNDEEASLEASRCLNCPNPRCVKGCPVNIEIPKFIAAVKEGNLSLAYDVISASSSLPLICGRVCPQEKQCESMCIKGFRGDAIAIGALERYVADYAMKNNFVSTVSQEKHQEKIAVVGSGPSGLTCAGELAKAGYHVTIYEALHKAGGVLTYGIPEFRLPANIVENEVNSLKKLGVNFVFNAVIGESLTIDDLSSEYDAIYIASGAGLPKFMGIPNETANGVFSANEILTRINLMNAYKEFSKTPIKEANVATVIGGGNVAMDAARSLRRLGMEVHLVYRRGMDELPARKEEVNHAQEEGIIFDILTNPTKVLVDNESNVIGLEVLDMELGNVGEDGRASVKKIEGSEHQINCDIIVMALGTSANPLATKGSNIKRNEKNLIVTDGTKTSLDKVYAGGDAVTGSATVILAMEAGKKAAQEIIESFKVC